MADGGGLFVTDELLALLSNLSCFGVALGRRLGDEEHGLQHQFLANAGLGELLPSDFFDDVADYERRLDENARLTR